MSTLACGHDAATWRAKDGSCDACRFNLIGREHVPRACPSCGSAVRRSVYPPCSLDAYDPDQWHSGVSPADQTTTGEDPMSNDNDNDDKMPAWSPEPLADAIEYAERRLTECRTSLSAKREERDRLNAEISALVQQEERLSVGLNALRRPRSRKPKGGAT